MKKLFAVLTLGIFFLVACTGTKNLQGSFSSAKSGGATVGPNLTITVNKSVQNKKIYEYSEMVVALAMDFKCKSSTGCSVSAINFQGYLDDDGDASSFATDSSATTHGTSLNYVGNMYLYDSADASGSKLGSVSYSSSTPFIRTFSSSTSPIKISANSTKTIYLTKTYVDGSKGFSDGDSENIAFGIAAATDVTAVDGDGTSLTVNVGPSGLNTSPTFYFSTSYGVEFSKGSGGASGTLPNTNGVNLLAMDFNCRSPGSCIISALDINGYLDDSGGSDGFSTSASSGSGNHSTTIDQYIKGLKLVNATTGKVVATANTSSGYAASFSSISLTPGATSSFYLVGDLYDGYQDGDEENFYFSIYNVTAASKIGVKMKTSGSATGDVITTTL